MSERDESNGVIYKDVCNPITAEFREELYTNILDAYARIKEPLILLPSFALTSFTLIEYFIFYSSLSLCMGCGGRIIHA